MLENSRPIMILYKRLVPDSGGAGRYRGGLGQEIGIRSESPNHLRLLVQNMKVHTPAIGYAGGKAGRNGGNRLAGRDLPGKTTVSRARGGSLDIHLSGGGGMVAPFTRPAEQVGDSGKAGGGTPRGDSPDPGG